LGSLIASGLIAPLEIANPDGFTTSTLNAFNYGGDYYGIPFTFENVAFFRNTDIVPDAPETWDEVLEISRELAADNGDTFADNKYGFVRMEGDPYHFFPIQTAFGGYVFGINEDGSYNPMDVGLGNEGSLAAAEFWGTMVEEGLQPPGVEWDLMHSMFESGQSAMTITGPWATDRIRESGIPYAISKIPGETQEGQPFLGVWGLVVNSFSEQQLLAGIFLNEYVATDEGMTALFEANKRPPTWIAISDMVEDADIAAFTEAGTNGLAMPAIPEMAQVWDAWGNAVVLVAQQAEAPDAAFTNAAEQVETLIAEAAQS
jgi:maltose-binding protein MalE